MIHARGLGHTFHTKQRGKASSVRAVDGIDLDVADGELVSVLGPNGAGKTTTLRILTTLLKPDEGSATVAGFDVVRQSEDVRRSIGYVSQSGSTFSAARAGEEVMDHGMLYGRTRAQVEKRGKELFGQLQLDGLWTRQPKTMSGGQKRRLDIVMGLIHEPTLIFLDEPTTGLDPQARANLWEHIRALRSERGATVVLTTHYLDEADALSDRIIVIDAGRVVANDTATNLKAGLAGDLVDLEISDAARVVEAADRLGSIGSGIETDGLHVRGRVRASGRQVPGLLRGLDRSGIALESIEIVRPTLDDVFLALTGRSLRDAQETAAEAEPTSSADAAPASTSGARS
jgi:ABC-2 type transport system ATP-binding protein